MKATKKNKTVFQQPNFSGSKADLARAEESFGNYFKGTKRQVETNIKEFSTMSMLMRMIKKSKLDPSDSHIMDVVKRMERDKLSSQLALNFANRCQEQAQSLQKIALIKMIPFFIGLLGVMVFSFLVFRVEPLNFTNPDFIKFAAPLLIFIPLTIWGMLKRKDAKLDMVTVNVLLQASSAYASAKMQGKGAVGALQNLGELRRRSKKSSS